MFVFSKSRAAKVLILAGIASAWPLATTVSKAQIANELPAPPAGPATRSVLVPPADESEAELPAPPALNPPALTPPALTPPREAPAGSPESEVGRQPGYLGLIGDLDSAGIRVLSVHEGGPAAAAGIRENDVITAVNGRNVATTEDMTDVISSHFAGDELQFDVRRGERPIQLTVTLGARMSDEEAAAVAGATPSEVMPAGRPRMGIHVATVTDALRADYGVDFPAGALITAVGAGSPADRAGLPAGGVIFSIDGNPVEREEDVVNHIAASSWGQEVELGYRYNEEDYRKSVRLAPPDPATAPLGMARGEALGEARIEADRPLTLRRRVLVPGGFVPGGPAVGRIQRMIQAYGGPYIRFAPEVYVEESPAIEAPPVRAPSTNSRPGASQEELNRLRRRVTELEDELAAEKAATP
jgi:hypothetical protein